MLSNCLWMVMVHPSSYRNVAVHSTSNAGECNSNPAHCPPLAGGDSAACAATNPPIECPPINVGIPPALGVEPTKSSKSSKRCLKDQTKALSAFSSGSERPCPCASNECTCQPSMVICMQPKRKHETSRTSIPAADIREKTGS